MTHMTVKNLGYLAKKSMLAEYLNVWSNTWFPLRFKVRPTEK